MKEYSNKESKEGLYFYEDLFNQENAFKDKPMTVQEEGLIHTIIDKIEQMNVSKDDEILPSITYWDFLQILLALNDRIENATNREWEILREVKSTLQKHAKKYGWDI